MEIRTDWRNFIVYSASTAIEISWLYVIVKVLNEQTANGQLSVFGILVFYPLSFGLYKMIRSLGLNNPSIKILNWLIWAILMLISLKVQLYEATPWTDSSWIASLPLAVPQLIYSFRPEIFLCIASGIAWLLGNRLAASPINFGALLGRFQFGLVILIIVFFTLSLLQINMVNAVPIVAIFFLASLGGISIAHARESRGWVTDKNRFQWSWILLASIGLIFLTGFIISLVISHDLLQLVIDTIKWVGKIVMIVLSFLASLLPKPEPGAVVPPMPEMPQMPSEDKPMILNIPEVLRNWLSIAMGIIWVALVVGALWQISTRLFSWLRGRFNTPNAEVEPIRGAFKADLMNLLRRIKMLFTVKLLGWLTGKSKAMPPEVFSIHQIYRQFLRWGAKSGYPRKYSETPNEYLASLSDVFPFARQELVLITEQYVSTRYSMRLPAAIDLKETRESWDRLRQSRIKKAKS